MNVEQVRLYCLSLPIVTEDLPFGPQTLALRIGGKIFALLPIDNPGSINLKCDPERSIELREEFPQITPGYHMNKKWWNTVHYEDLPTKMVEELICHSYSLVLGTLTKKERAIIDI
jgi:predicted DNA-binding protein (MmcQ/YjbR family)